MAKNLYKHPTYKAANPKENDYTIIDSEDFDKEHCTAIKSGKKL